MLLDKKTWCPGPGCAGNFVRQPDDPEKMYWKDQCDVCGYRKFLSKYEGLISYVDAQGKVVPTTC